MNGSCLEFGPNESKFVLKVPKVLSMPIIAQVITRSAVPASENEKSLHLLCPVRALRASLASSGNQSSYSEVALRGCQ